QAIAHLLVNLSLNKEDLRQRTLAVIGLRAFTAEANRQADAYRPMADELSLALANDLQHFEQSHRQVVAQLQLLTDNLNQRRAALDHKKANVARHEALLNARIADLKGVREELEAATGESRAALGELAKEQRRLFDAEHRVGTRLAENQQLERQISTLEKV